jgi:RNA polymerase sigma factor (sigma-70 family)
MDSLTDQLLELLAREGPRLHSLLARLTLDRHAAEDLMQELFVKAGSRVPSTRNPAAYLRRAAIHLAFDWRRSRRRAADALARAQHDREKIDPSRPDGSAIWNEQWQLILNAAEKLSGQAREVFVLHYLERQSFDALAEQMNKTPHQVRALASKAVAEVRENVKAHEAKEASHVRR